MCKDCNQYMGGCDRANALWASYSVYLIHQHRWYMWLVYYGIDRLLIASNIYFKAKKVDMSQKMFRLALVQGLFARSAQLWLHTWRRGTPPWMGRLRIPPALMSKPPEDMRRISQQCVDEGHVNPVTRAYPFRLINVGEHLPEIIKGRRNYCKWCYYVENVQRRGLYNLHFTSHICVSQRRGIVLSHGIQR